MNIQIILNKCLSVSCIMVNATEGSIGPRVVGWSCGYIKIR